MADQEIVTLTVCEGNKPGEPVAFHGSRKSASIVFLPKSAPLNQQVRVRLETIKGPDGSDRTDRAGKPMYRGKPAPDQLTTQWAEEGGEIARFEIPIDWLGQPVEDEIRELERRVPAERFGTPYTRPTSRLVWGSDMGSTVVETASPEFTPIERESVQDGQLVWTKTSEVAGPVTTTQAAVTKLEVVSRCAWAFNRLAASYDPAWSFQVKATYRPAGSPWESTYEHTGTWGEVPAWYQADLTPATCACGRNRVDPVAAKGYPRCEQCRKEAACDRCGKVTGKVTQAGPRAVCDACLPWEQAEQAIDQFLPADRRAALANVAKGLCNVPAYEGEASQAVLRACFADLQEAGLLEQHLRSKGGPHAWVYCAADGLWGSQLPPAALLLLSHLPEAAGDGLVELVGWLASPTFYLDRQAGKSPTPPVLTKNSAESLTVATFLTGTPADRQQLEALATDQRQPRWIREMAEEGLRESEQRYRRTLEAIERSRVTARQAGGRTQPRPEPPTPGDSKAVEDLRRAWNAH